MKKLTILLLLVANLCFAQVVPKLYYTFDLSNPLAPTNGTTALTGTGQTIVTDGVGKSVSIQGSTALKGGNAAIDTFITISFMLKPDYLFSTVRDPQIISYGGTVFYLQWPNFRFITKLSNGTSDNFQIPLDGVGPANYQYYLNKWTHFSCVFNAKTGFKAVYIDGLLPTGFSTTVATGVISSSPLDALVLNSGTVSYQKVFARYDEVAVYNKALTAAEVYKQYFETSAGSHYTGLSAAFIPLSPATTAAKRITDYALGYTLGSGTSANATYSPRTQLVNFPLPRFKPGHTMPPNVPWVDQKYFAENLQAGTTTTGTVDSSRKIMTELVTNWNYYALVSDHIQNRRNDYSDTNKFAGAWVALANRNSSWKTCGISYWDQMRPNTAGYALTTSPYILNKSLPAAYYLKNASGQFLDKSGAVTTVLANKVISPIAPYDSIYQDGLTLNTHLTSLDAYLNRPLNYLSENCEVLPKWSNTALGNDPSVVSAKPGTQTLEEFQASKRMNIFKIGYVSKFANNPVLSGASIMLYNQTAWDGTFAGIQNYASLWNTMRLAQGTLNGKIYATMDLYARWPNNWRNWVSAWRGLQPYLECKNVELASGDSLNAPFIGAGWDPDEEKNIRNGQWLGLLKIYSSLGAEYYHTGYFNEGASYSTSNPPASPRGYANQMVAPIYAQAITSRWENTFRHGAYMPGDVPINYATASTAKSFMYYSGSYQIVTSVRQNPLNTVEYVITTTYQPMNNMDGGQDTVADAKITLAGNVLQFKSRRQGSVYNYNSSTGTFYQYDSWHEATYPDRWTQDINLEAEVTDYGTPPIKTYGQTGTDYRNSFAVVSYADTATVFDSLKYVVSPRTSGTHYVWFKARSRTGATGKIIFRMNSAVDTVSGVSSTDWYWYRLNNGTSTKFSYSLTANENNILSMVVSNKYIEVDQIVFTKNASLSLPETSTPCSITASIIASGDTSLCTGETLVLNASPSKVGNSYLWSTGATTQYIGVFTAGTFTVTVYDDLGCSGTATPVVTSLHALPAAPTITKTAGSICYGDSVQLTVSSSAVSPSYLWSTGQTTTTLYTPTTGYYQVTVTDQYGCTAQKDTLIVFNTSTIPTSFTVNGNLTQCIGESITLVSNNPHTAYAWYKNNTYVGSASLQYANSPGWYKLISIDDLNCYGYSDSVYYKWHNCDTCERPRNLVSSGITKTTATISWSSTTGANYFIVYLKNVQTGNIIKSTIPGNIRKTKFSVLTPITYYQYYIDAICSNGDIIRSTIKTFKTPIR